MRTTQELDYLREQAVALRRQGKSRRQIKEILGPMSNATLDEALRGEPAQRFWLEVTGASPSQFHTPTLKRHNPKTVRKNVGDGYHGCLRIDVRRSSSLYRKIEGRTAAITSGG
jgi:hypothetical protein